MAESIHERDRAIRADIVARAPKASIATAHSVRIDIVDRIAVISGLDSADVGGQASMQQPDAAYKPSVKAADVLDRIGWDITVRVSSPPRCSRRDAALCESILLEDVTLDEAGARAGLTRERMRQILLKHTGLSTKDLTAHRGELREARRLVTGRAEVVRLAAAQAEATLQDLAAASGLTVAEVAEIVGTEEALRRRARNTWTVGTSEEAVLAEMRRVASLPGGTPLTSPFYDDQRVDGALKSVRIVQRFGTWHQACERAGLAVKERDRHYERTWSRAQLLDWVEAYVDDVGATRASYAGFDSWLRARKAQGAPSGQTVRNYLGRWTDILRAVATHRTSRLGTTGG